MNKSLPAIIDFLFPRHCSVCGKRLHVGEESLCTSCLMDLHLVDYADGREGNKLERSLWEDLPVVRAASFLVYDRENSQRQLVLDLKYHNRPKIGEHLAPIMVRKLNTTGFFDGVDVILPIPISGKRREHRGYNQSESIARGISRHTGIPVDTRSLKRRHYATSQTKLSVAQRRENIKGTFLLRHPDRLRGKHILIVDDVITSNNTILACGHALMQIPGISISVLSLAVSRNHIRNIRISNPQPESDN